VRPKHTGVLVAVAVLLVVAACNGELSGDESSAGGGGAETTTLSLGLIPITAVAPVYLGIEHGFFEEEGLVVEPEMAQEGASIITGVLNGERQIGFAAVVPLINSRVQNLDVKMISGAWIVDADPEVDPSRIWVPPDSDIESPADLTGKQVATNALQAVFQLVVDREIAADGGDPSQTRYVVVPLPNMIQALEAGEVDAIITTEPFTLQAEQAGFREIGRPYSGALPDATIAAYFVSDAYLDENPDVVERFRRAMDTASQYANDNPDEVREIVTTYTSLSPEVAAEIRVENFQTAIDERTIELTGEQMVEFGYIPEVPPTDELVHTP
jgi:NitT/TauT family transport system substrate-binding protein